MFAERNQCQTRYKTNVEQISIQHSLKNPNRFHRNINDGSIEKKKNGKFSYDFVFKNGDLTRTKGPSRRGAPLPLPGPFPAVQRVLF